MKLVSGGPYAGFACGAFDFPSIPLPYSPFSRFYGFPPRIPSCCELQSPNVQAS